jgi:chromate transporter
LLSFANKVTHTVAKIQKVRRWQFLKTVFWLGCTAFGGPQMHIPAFMKRFVDEKRFCDKETLLDINAFCSILPGPSTTQTITALGFKLGGPRLAFQSLLAWLLPGAAILTVLTISPRFLADEHLRLLPAMVAAFMCYAVVSMFSLIRPGFANYFVFILSGLAGFFLQSPLVFPLGIIIGAIISVNFGNRPYVPNTAPFGKIRWANLSLYITIFVLVGVMGFLLSENEHLFGISRPFILFENTYRMGSLAFGGGNTLAAMAVEQYVIHKPRLTMDEINVGIGLIQGLPGPNFNLAVYLNGIAMRTYGFGVLGQLGGCVIGMIAIFLPGTLLVFFAFPVWNKIQTYPIIQRSMDGIFAASVGFILSAAMIITVYFYKSHIPTIPNIEHYSWLVISFIALLSKKIPTPIVVLGTIVAGVLLPL